MGYVWLYPLTPVLTPMFLTMFAPLVGIHWEAGQKDKKLE
jgi:hypothetical protein